MSNVQPRPWTCPKKPAGQGRPVGRITKKRKSKAFKIMIPSLLFGALFIFGLIGYVLAILGKFPDSFFGLVIIAIILDSFSMILLKWTPSIGGYYKGNTRLMPARMVLLTLIALLQPVNLVLGNSDAVLCGFIMLFSLLSFYSYYYGKKSEGILWFRFY
jgi:hypothetical protein